MVEEPEIKKSLGRPKRTLYDNIKICRREMGWCDMDWIYLAQDKGKWKAVMSRAINFRVPYNIGKILSS
jgi:hypothetical protein